jgi:hypothetical protein
MAFAMAGVASDAPGGVVAIGGGQFGGSSLCRSEGT